MSLLPSPQAIALHAAREAANAAAAAAKAERAAPPPVVLIPEDPKLFRTGRHGVRNETTDPYYYQREYQGKQAEVQSAAIKKRTTELEGLFDSKNPDLLYGGKKRRKTHKRTKKSKKHKRRRGTRKY